MYANVLPNFLRKQALAPATTLRTLTPSLIRFRPINQQDTIEFEVEHASVATLLTYRSVSSYFKRVACTFNADYHYVQSLFVPHTSAPRVSYVSGLTAEGIAANKARIALELRARSEADAVRRMMQQGIADTRRYHLKALDQKTLVSCPITGIVFEVQMPSIPVFMQHTHPLASLSNVQSTLEWFFVTSQIPNRLSELDAPVLSGILLVLLRAKHILLEEETSALAENAALQVIPKGTLAEYVKLLHRGWELNKVWQAMPKLRLNAEGQSVLATLNAWFAKASFHVAGKPTLDVNVQAKLFESTRSKTAAQKSLRVYSAETAQHRQVKENKETAQTLFNSLKDQMPQLLRTLVRTTISDLMLITPKSKETVTAAIAKAFLGTKSEALARQLVSVIEATHNNHIMLELGRVSDDFNLPKRSISEILAEKANKAKGN